MEHTPSIPITAAAVAVAEPSDQRLLVAFHDLSRVVIADQPLSETLALVAGIAKTLTPGAAELSITLVHQHSVATAAFTGQLAVDLDERQHEAGHGPCLSAAALNQTILIGDMAAEPRWPDFAAAALAAGVHCSLSIPLQIQQRVMGSVNIYARTADAFDEHEIALARAFASYAASALDNAQALTNSQAIAAQLAEAMHSRAAIEQAKGILMGQRRCTPDEAFLILRGLSQTANRKLRDVAQALVDSAAPKPSPPPKHPDS